MLTLMMCIESVGLIIMVRGGPQCGQVNYSRTVIKYNYCVTRWC